MHLDSTVFEVQAAASKIFAGGALSKETAY